MFRLERREKWWKINKLADITLEVGWTVATVAEFYVDSKIYLDTNFIFFVDLPQLHRILIRFNCVLFIDFPSPLWLANICTWLTSSLRNFIKNDEEKFIYVLFSFLRFFHFSKAITLAKLFSHGQNQKWNQTEDPSLALTFTNNILNIWMKRNVTNNSCDVTSPEWKRKNKIKYWKVCQKESFVVKEGMSSI